MGACTLHLPHIRLARDGDLVEVLDRVVVHERMCEHGAELGRGAAENDLDRPGGLTRGPRRLTSVRCGSALRMGAMGARSGWYLGARKKLKYGYGDAGMCARVEGGESGWPSAWRRSADPEGEVDAQFPC